MVQGVTLYIPTSPSILYINNSYSEPPIEELEREKGRGGRGSAVKWLMFLDNVCPDLRHTRSGQGRVSREIVLPRQRLSGKRDVTRERLGRQARSERALARRAFIDSTAREVCFPAARSSAVYGNAGRGRWAVDARTASRSFRRPLAGVEFEGSIRSSGESEAVQRPRPRPLDGSC